MKLSCCADGDIHAPISDTSAPVLSQLLRLLLLLPPTQAVGNEIDKPHHKLHVAQDLMRTAAYGTPALLTFYDLDEFLVIPSGQPITSLLAQGGCLAGVRTHKQVLIRSKITVASNWSNTDPGVVGELPGWLVHDVWIDALEALDYSMAPQGFLGWKAIVDPNTDYNFNCKSPTS